MNDALIARLNLLENKVRELVERYKLIRQECAYLAEENANLKEIIKKQTIQINNLENQYKISKIVASIAPDAESAAELREKIDAYITDIDRCIDFLSK
ncbi:MAG: hypothetical protein RMJ97_09680 [Raineya sp.]|nr:hypothetical protein [Raineya sp.]MDW8297135.1 hypothetical protein [Raineya sp.]